MTLKKIKHILIRLSNEEKAIGISALAVLIGNFLPWYSYVFNYDGPRVIETGLTGELGIIGFTATLMSLIALAFMLSKHFYLPLPHFGIKKDKIVLFLMAESAFIILLAFAIYTKKSLDATDAEINFGLYTSLLGACIATFATFAQIQKDTSEESKAIFEQANEPIERIIAIKHEVKQPSPTIKTESFEKSKMKNEPTSDENQGSYFLREAGVRKEPHNK